MSRAIWADALLSAVLVTCSPGAPAHSQPEPARTRPELAEERSSLLLTRLDLEVDLDVGQGRLSGTARLTLKNVGTKDVRAVPLLLGRLLHVSRAEGESGSRLDLRQAVRIFDDEPMLQVNQVVPRLGRPLPPGASTTLGLRYSGAVVGYTEVGWRYVRDRVAPDFTILREDAFAFPVPGVLSMAENRRAPREDLDFLLRVTAPKDLLVATGGELVERREAGAAATTTYRSRDRVPFLNVAIAPYRVLEKDGIRVFHFPEDEDGARAVVGAAARAIELLTGWFGPLGRAPLLTVMEIPEGFGSQASLSGGILQTADAFRRVEARHQLYHELSHLWNAPDRDAPSPRWNEGLASFLERRLASEIDAGVVEGVDLDGRAEKTAQALVERCREEPRCATVPLAGYGEAGMTDWSYRVGHLFFHVLFRVVGAKGFDAALGGHFQAHRERGGTTRQLAERIRQLSPAASAVVEEWVTTARWHARLQAGETIASIVASCRQPEGRVRLRVDASEAEAVLAILDASRSGRAVPEELWARLTSTEPYVRLKKRESSLKRDFTDGEFREFVLSPGLAAKAPELARALEAWKKADLDDAARKALAYLPEEAVIRATVYLLIKPIPNSFVFEVQTNPAIFLYLDPAVSPPRMANTVAHELHHIGFASLGDASAADLATLPPAARTAAEWMGAFGEGVAMLAAAGSPDVHPHAASDEAERARWDADSTRAAEDLAALDRFFLDVVEGRLKAKEEIQEKAFSFFGIQGPWYTVGYRMAVTVERQAGRAGLISCLSDPRKLLAAYQRAEVALAAKAGRKPALWSPELLRRVGAGGGLNGEPSGPVRP